MEANNEQDKYGALAEKWLNGTISEEEEKEFAEWYNNRLDKPLQVPAAFAESEEALKQRIFQRIQNKKNKSIKFVLPQQRKFLQIAAVVILIICSGIGMQYLNLHGGQQTTKKLQIVPPTPSVVPADNQAILTLADGSQIILDSVANGILANQGRTQVMKMDGQLTYAAHGAPDEAQYNTITTPKGGMYQVILPDGSRVWLNAATSLKFPTAFTGKDRLVELSGEAYFEVAKNPKIPFQVKVNDVAIRVLGTHFNVMAYNDEQSVKTTLLEGAVKISKGNKETLLHPGQQASASDQDEITVLPVDVDEAIAWKNGIFEFNGNIQGIMRQIARWYNVEVVYEGKVTDKAFGGAISRKENIADVLRMLELTGSIHFKVEGNRVIVRTK